MGWERAISSLFEAPEAGKPLSARDLALREIYESVFTLWCEHPERSDQQMARWVVEHFARTSRQAYHDVSVVKSALGNVQHAAKEWHRYRVLEMLAQAYQLARANEDVAGMVRAASQIGRFTQLDKPESVGIDWDSLESPSFEPSADPALLGLRPGGASEQARRRLERKYGLAGPEPAGDDTTEAGDDTTEAGDDTTEAGDDTTEAGDDANPHPAARGR